MKLFLATLASLLALAGFSKAALADHVGRDIMRLVPVAHGDGVELYIENSQTAEITVTLSFELSNMAADVALPITQTVPGLKTVRAAALHPTYTGPWSYSYSLAWTWGSVNAHHDDSYLYTLPYQSGASFRIDQGYHGRFSHTGDMEYALDFNMPRGTPICAARDGVVVGVEDRFGEGGPDPSYQTRVNYVMIKHADGTVGEYAHLLQGTARVAPGQQVRAGETIALSGNSGFTTGPHLHFYVYKALDGSQRESFPVRFVTLEETAPTVLMEGRAYGSP